MAQSFLLVGGAHDGERIDATQSHPETLFAISLDDGSSYARAGARHRDDAGVLREVFRFDADGSLTEAAKAEFAGVQ